ncbi:MAG: glycosyltransferase family A protein [Candidatus Nanopelagicales bacterium]
MVSELSAVDLTIGYSTLAERAGHIVAPDPAAGFELLILVQGWSGTHIGPAGSTVPDVPGLGVARSRNAALDRAGRRYLLFCDDDVAVDLAGVGPLVRKPRPNDK